ncbi:MAG: DUF1428 domain-containing protein [Candidatus Sumerlaeaceae bacterium]|nr:DUF1428 domain-containing protein [Candidatus Sumerlaeaceae bacterium]
MPYVDGYVLPVLKKDLPAYRRIALKAAKIWIEHGALEVRECAGEDLKPAFGIQFPKLIKTKPGETVVFSWIVYKSRAHRDKVNAKVMKDPRMNDMGSVDEMPFDCKRIVYGGFETIVSVQQR